MKSFVIRAAIGMSILLALSGCEEYEGVDYLNIGHPADPGAPSGKRARMSGALTSENISVTPQLGSIGLSPLQMQSGGRVMNKPMMDHSKMKQPMVKQRKKAPAMNHRGSN